MNETEVVQVLEGMPGKAAHWARSLGGDPTLDLEQIAKLFHEAKVHTVIATLVAQGVFYPRPGIKVDKGGGHDSRRRYVCGSLRHDPLLGGQESSSHAITHDPAKEAITAANAATAKCVQIMGAIQSIPWGYE
jgi:sugar/nucleoside kinase (ribokinase family)